VTDHHWRSRVSGVALVSDMKRGRTLAADHQLRLVVGIEQIEQLLRLILLG
jgi:hypothetical protein